MVYRLIARNTQIWENALKQRHRLVCPRVQAYRPGRHEVTVKASKIHSMHTCVCTCTYREEALCHVGAVLTGLGRLGSQ